MDLQLVRMLIFWLHVALAPGFEHYIMYVIVKFICEQLENVKMSAVFKQFMELMSGYLAC